jgi:hypothetical protein
MKSNRLTINDQRCPALVDLHGSRKPTVQRVMLKQVGMIPDVRIEIIDQDNPTTRSD